MTKKRTALAISLGCWNEREKMFTLRKRTAHYLIDPNVAWNAPSKTLENFGMKCPRCGVHLHNSTLMDFPINRCSACGGIWVDHGTLPQFMKMKARLSASEGRASRDSLKNVWPAGLSGMGKALGGE